MKTSYNEVSEISKSNNFLLGRNLNQSFGQISVMIELQSHLFLTHFWGI